MIFEYVQSLFNRFGYKRNPIKSCIFYILDFIDYQRINRKIFKTQNDYELLIEFSNILETLENYYGDRYLSMLNPFVVSYIRTEKIAGKPTLHSLQIYCSDSYYRYTIQFKYQTANLCDSSKDIFRDITIYNIQTGNNKEYLVSSSSSKESWVKICDELIDMSLRTVLLAVIDIIRLKKKHEFKEDNND